MRDLLWQQWRSSPRSEEGALGISRHRRSSQNHVGVRQPQKGGYIGMLGQDSRCLLSQDSRIGLAILKDQLYLSSHYTAGRIGFVDSKLGTLG